MSCLLAAQEKDRVVQLNAGLDRALNLFTVRASFRSNTTQLGTVASTLKGLDGEVSQKFVALHLELERSSGPHITVRDV
ncbi:hypothetical protein C8J57DRAFT_1521567 [Mycena rebaudengoi]|nr:hypothetical protein C8J57DRAFT_1521567 [Mycena rebaudengoi]